MKLRPHLKEIVEGLKSLTFDPYHNEDSFNDIIYGKPGQTLSVLKKCSSDEIILLDTLFYTGNAILCNILNLPKNPYEARQDVKKRCILNMENDELAFGTKPEEWQINIWGKKREALAQNIEKAMSYLDFVGDKDSEENILCKTTD